MIGQKAVLLQGKTVRWLNPAKMVGALVIACLLLAGVAFAQDDFSWVVGAQPVYVLPDPSSPVVLWVDSLPVKLTGRDVTATWFQIALANGGGWLTASALKIAGDPLALPVVAVTPDAVLDGALFWNVTPFVRDVFNLGQTLGSRANYFSKVGDSITVNQAFLHPLGEGRYHLGAYTDLQPVLDFFGSGRDSAFSRQSLAAGVGWRAADLLRRGDVPPGCYPGESPLACEYRTARPAFALIMIGTNDVVITTPEQYQQQLSEIVDMSLRAGTVPVLSTIPPQPQYADRVRVFNRIIVEVAALYRVPLWNYWLALRDLPNAGLAYDGVHPSLPPNLMDAATFTPANLQYGATWRNLTALQLLKMLLEAVR
ncbi:MAG: SGNH/GDSL hydrolase family protein [Chloroflexi bacterium]|nr:SGNH/GDSL hydrolase family protein [Chloroflexota bacterium]